jgi:hypothetical protein
MRLNQCAYRGVWRPTKPFGNSESLLRLMKLEASVAVIDPNVHGGRRG